MKFSNFTAFINIFFNFLSSYTNDVLVQEKFRCNSFDTPYPVEASRYYVS